MGVTCELNEINFTNGFIPDPKKKHVKPLNETIGVLLVVSKEVHFFFVI